MEGTGWMREKGDDKALVTIPKLTVEFDSRHPLHEQRQGLHFKSPMLY